MNIRLNKAIKEFGVGQQTISDFLKKKGCPLESEDKLTQKFVEMKYDFLL